MDVEYTMNSEALSDIATKSISFSDRVKNKVELYLQLAESTPTGLDVYDAMLAYLEEPLLEHALKLFDGNQVLTAKALGMNRGTFRKKCKQYGLI